ncbi:MAG: LysM peptidoglycan-binding domain-containing M23 family metallopeptidase [Bacillota bacterium]
MRLLRMLTIIILCLGTLVPATYGQLLPIPVPKAQTFNTSNSLPVTHVIVPGESLWGIARTNKVALNKLMAVNGIENPDQIFAGQILTIPKEKSMASRGVQTVLATADHEWLWPVLGVITSDYGLRRGEFHHGLDIAAETGEPIRAALDGKVSFVGWLNSIYGFAVVIDHPDDLQTLYAHTSQNLVEKNQTVEAGTPVALIGETGRTTGPHLHFEVRRQGHTLDPASFLEERSNL